MTLTVQQVAQMAPDSSSLDAARKLLKPTLWPVRAQGADGRAAWGECQGSGSTPYRISLSVDDLGYKCTCPSRKFPCKHVLALLWQLAERPAEFAVDAQPAWVDDWLARRRPRTGAAPSPAPGAPVSLDAPAPAAEPVDPEAQAKAEARAAAQRERLRVQREQAVSDGLDDLDRWIVDRLDAGLAVFPGVAHAQCRTVASRLVDAKAPALGRRVDELPTRLMALADEDRPRFLVEELGALHLVAAAYRRRDALDPALREDVRRAIGWTTERAALLEDPATRRVEATWRVLAARTEVQADGLRRLETWAWAEDAVEPRFGLLLDFVPVTVGAVAAPFAAGERFHGTLAYFPSADPLRAVLAARAAVTTDPRPLVGAPTLAAALDAFDRALDACPILEARPLAVEGLRLVETVAGPWLVDGDGDGLPVVDLDDDERIGLLGLDLRAAGVWDGRALRLLAADTALGPWYAP